jgi:FMN-dependent oxidoreductase (nitrilotriacetate monooxygenase family)
MNTTRKLHFGIVADPMIQTTWGWRQPGVETGTSTKIAHYMRLVQCAEQAKLDFMFVSDSVYITPQSMPYHLNKLEPITQLSALAGATSRIGLAGTVSTSFEEPFTVARQLASLDNISGGRAGWNVVTTGFANAALNHSLAQPLDHGLRYRRAEEHLTVVRALWDSWEDDAFVYDKENDVFFDREKLHILNHEGEFFKVQGPLNIARSPQGHPVIFQAGASEAGRSLAAKSADAIFVRSSNLEAAQTYHKDIKSRAAAYGRDPDHLLIFSGIDPIVGATDAEAEAKYRHMTEFVTLGEALKQLSQLFGGHDFLQCDPEALFPELGNIGSNGYRSQSDHVKADARDNKRTLREAALQYVTPRSEFIGNPQRVADAMQRWFENGGTDGFMISCHLAGGLEDFIEKILPLLRERGIFRSEYEATTLRGNLGLPIPQNRYA